MTEENLMESARTILEEMIGKLGIEAEVSIAETEGDERKLELKSGEAGRLIGRKGQSLEGLELILNRILRKQTAEEDSTPWVVIEVDGYSVPHHDAAERHGRLSRPEMERLEMKARDIAKEVKRWGDPKKIGPYKPGERRVIHMALRDDPDVETESDPEPDENNCKMVEIRLVSK
ncbi:MAG: KH domain-containing protein [Victivallales bacterium]|nr:KH domain-containing protein [Victivallales bacterium]MBR6059937.1 KH domain-containing protein [Victivallales bacterium]